jgi:hypothetical protein
MNFSRGPHFDWVESSVIEDIEVDFAKTFSYSEKESNLEITRWPINPSDYEDELDSSIQSKPVFGFAELSYFAVRPFLSVSPISVGLMRGRQQPTYAKSIVSGRRIPTAVLTLQGSYLNSCSLHMQFSPVSGTLFFRSALRQEKLTSGMLRSDSGRLRNSHWIVQIWDLLVYIHI